MIRNHPAQVLLEAAGGTPRRVGANAAGASSGGEPVEAVAMHAWRGMGRRSTPPKGFGAGP